MNRPSDRMMGASVKEKWQGHPGRVVVGILASLLALVVVFVARSSAHRTDAPAGPVTAAKVSDSAPYAIPSELVKAPSGPPAPSADPSAEPAQDSGEDPAIADRLAARKQAALGNAKVSRRPARATAHAVVARSKVARVDEAAPPAATATAAADATKTGESAKKRVPLVDDRRRVNILE